MDGDGEEKDTVAEKNPGNERQTQTILLILTDN